MKLKLKLPRKRWKKMLFITFLVLLVVFAIVFAFLEYSVYREVTTAVEVKNPEGVKTALLIYHPGLTSYANDVAHNFAEGLAGNGWRVEIATASPQAPTNLSNYRLLTLIWPIYDLGPGPTIANHVKRIGDLQGIDTAIITIGGGIDPFDAVSAMRRTVEDANGTIRASMIIFRGGGFAEKALNVAAAIMP